jgi:hypothetical protein
METRSKSSECLKVFSSRLIELYYQSVMPKFFVFVVRFARQNEQIMASLMEFKHSERFSGIVLH